MARTKSSRTFVAAVVALAWTTTSSAQDHIVSAEAASARLLEARAEQSTERARLQAVLSSAERDGNALWRWGAKRTRPNVAFLSDQEVHDLDIRAHALSADRAAGGLNTGAVWAVSVGGSLLLVLTAYLVLTIGCDEQCRNSPL